MKMKDEDYVWKILNTSTHNRILFFTNYGKVYMKTAIDLPKSGRTARGSALINYIPSLSKGERVTELLDIDAAGEDTKYLLMVTKKGYVKKTEIAEYRNINKNGLIAIRLNEGDELVTVLRVKGDEDVIWALASAWPSASPSMTAKSGLSAEPLPVSTASASLK